MLDSGYLPIETGYYRLPNGQMHVAVLTRMPCCSGEMVDWWFGHILDAQTYRRWHPKSHLALRWDKNKLPGHYVGTSHIIKKKLHGDVIQLRIHYHDPCEFLDMAKLEKARAGAVICANIYDFQKVPQGRVIHIIRDLDFGCEMRSRFWLFKASEAESRALMEHCIEEMGNLADFLPDLFAGKNGPLPGSIKSLHSRRYSMKKGDFLKESSILFPGPTFSGKGGEHFQGVRRA